MIGRLMVIDSRWARIGLALAAVTLIVNLTPTSYLGIVFPATPSPEVASSADLPAGLEAAISTIVGEAYLIGPGPHGTLEARSPRQDLQVHFSADGFGVRPTVGEWSFDLSVTRFGRQDQLVSVAAAQPVAIGARVEYSRATFTEW